MTAPRAFVAPARSGMWLDLLAEFLAAQASAQVVAGQPVDAAALFAMASGYCKSINPAASEHFEYIRSLIRAQQLPAESSKVTNEAG